MSMQQENLLFVVYPLIDILSVMLDISHVSIRDMERRNVPLSLLQKSEDI